MRVNQGTLRFNLGSDYSTLLRDLYKAIDSSAYIANVHANEVLCVDGRNRMPELYHSAFNSDESDDDESVSYSAGAYTDNSEVIDSDKTTTRLSNERIYRLIIQDISMYPDLNTRKAMVGYFLTQGFHVIYPGFGLLTDSLVYNQSPFAAEVKMRIIEENKQINEAVRNFISTISVTWKNNLEKFYVELDKIGRDYLSTQAIKDYGDQLLYMNWSDLTRATDKYILGDQVSFNTYHALLNNLRKQNSQYLSPNAGTVQAVLGISSKVYNNCKASMARQLVQNYGDELGISFL